MKVLLVEDEEMLNNIIAKRLRVESMTVDCCFDGETALDHINTSSYDVVVMDVMIPKNGRFYRCATLAPGRQQNAGIVLNRQRYFGKIK